MSIRKFDIPGLILGLILLVASLGLAYTVYGRLRPILQLRGEVQVVEGNVSETLIQQREDRLLPFKVKSYVLRYAFPAPPRGQIRTGEQVVTRRFYNAVERPGAYIDVYFHPDDPGINAVQRSLSFAGTTGWRAGIALALSLASLFAISWGTTGLISRRAD